MLPILPLNVMPLLQKTSGIAEIMTRLQITLPFNEVIIYYAITRAIICYIVPQVTEYKIISRVAYHSL